MIKTLREDSSNFQGLLIELAERGYYQLNRYFYENDKYQNEVVIEQIRVFGITKEDSLKEIEEIIRKIFPNEEIWMEPDLFAEDIDLDDFEFFDTEEEQF